MTQLTMLKGGLPDVREPVQSPTLQLREVHYRYGAKPVLEGINLTLPRGVFVGLQGANGSGKSTLLRLMLGLLAPTSGEVIWEGAADSAVPRANVAYVSQQVRYFNRQFPATVEEVVMTGLLHRSHPLWRWRQARDKVQAALQRVGMEEHLRRRLGELSGGQQQRVFLARALADQPDLLFLDEPTAGLDEESRVSFYQRLADLHREGMTIVLVGHDNEHMAEAVEVLLEIKERAVWQVSGEVKVSLLQRQRRSTLV